MISTAAPQSTAPEQYAADYVEAQSGVAARVARQSRGWPARLATIARIARQTIAGGVHRLCPGYFALERSSGAGMQLSQGVTWQPDSFWAVSLNSHPR